MTDPATETRPRKAAALTGLSARLLLLTVAFVMVAEFLIWAPSVSRYRKTYLEDQIANAHLAALALEATPDNMVSDTLERELLFHADAYGVTLKYADRRTLMLSDEMPRGVDVEVDLRRGNFLIWIRDAFETFAQDGNRVLRVIGMSTRNPPDVAPVLIEVVMDEAPMRRAMVDYSTRILQLSVVISLFTAWLIYVSLQWLMVRPIHRITQSMTRFRTNPEDLTRVIAPGSRRDEIGIAERELADMQKELNAALKQKNRLAALGGAVAKINHDLRNSLATAELATGRLASIDDPEVKEVMPRLIGSIDQAVAICTQTLNYASDRAGAFDPSRFHLQELVAEAAAALRDQIEQENSGIATRVQNDVPFDVDVVADRTHLFRALYNLVLNAHQAGAAEVRVTAEDAGAALWIDVADNGPGFDARAKDKLFQPFAGSARRGGTGLGLVIAREAMAAHGGDVTLVTSQNAGQDVGARLRLVLPRRGADGMRDAD